MQGAFIETNELFKYIWLFIVALIGAITGFFSKNKDGNRRTFRNFIMGVVTSMFISYITYEIAIYFFHANGLAVALAGLASFTGTDLAVTFEHAFIEFIERKFKNL